MSSVTPFSVVIICRDEARTITSCINAAKRLSHDIIVVDSGSSDGTDLLAQEAGATLIRHAWEGYGANKNVGIRAAAHDWIISVDADEVMNEDLILYLSTFVPERGTVYQLNSLVHLEGQWVRYSGWHPVWKNRIFHKRDQRWNDAAVHEDLTPLANAAIERLPGLLLHYSYKDRADHQQRMHKYAALKAEVWYKSSKGPGLLKRWLGPSFRAFQSYVIKQGWRDGDIGRYIATSNATMMRLAIKAYDDLAKKE
jgi:glycosyltransferase involved in cell wall biosynthesis